MSEQLSLELGIDQLLINLGELLIVDSRYFAITLEKEIALMRLSGMSEPAIFTVLEQDAATGGRIFGEFENTIKSQIFGGIQTASAIGEQEVYKAAGIDTNFQKWVTFSKRPCPDCDDRSGRVEPLAVWQAAGTPGSGATVCRANCMCRLEPVEFDTPDSVDISGLE